MRQDEDGITWRMLRARARFEDARVLEIGCGPGRVTAMYAHITRMTAGLEPDAAAVAQAAHDVRGPFFVRGSGMALSFSDQAFDVAVFSLSLHHHPDPALALDEAARVLAPTGRLLALEPVAEGEVQRLCNVFVNEDHALDAAERALDACGLRRITRDIFETRWTFDDFRDVETYAFGYYGRPDDPTEADARAAALRAFLGRRADGAPIHLSDTLRLTTLAVP